MLQFPLVLIDTEYTADENSRRTNWRGQHREIIQVGVLALDHKLTVLDSLRAYVRPKLNPVLSEYIKKLTGIRQTDVNGAPELPEAWKKIGWYYENRAAYSFGGDREVFAENFKIHDMPVPDTVARMHDIRPFLRERCAAFGIRDFERYTSGTLCEAFGIKGLPAQDALNDMHNLRRVLLELRSRGLL